MLARLAKPSFSDFIFLAILFWMFALAPEGFSGLLRDGETGWHIRAGQWILAHHAVPTQDLFSFSKAGQPWFAWEWGTDVIYALLYSVAGLKAITLVAAVLIATFATMLLRMTIARGAAPGPALVTTFLAVGACTIHYLARPHLATLLMVPLFAWILDRNQSKQDSWLWALVPLMALWTNLHGGFLAGLAIIGIYFAGTVIETLWNRDPQRPDWLGAIRLAMVGAVTAAATFVNPYGYHLHQHLATFMNSSWVQEGVSEFQSPVFRGEYIRQYEILLLAGLMAAALRLSRRSVCPALLLVFWAHQSLTSVRHVTIYSTVAVPWIAVEATLVWKQLAARASRKSVLRALDDLSNDSLANFRHTSAWPVAAIAALAILPFAHIQWPSDFPADVFPVEFIAKHEARIRNSAHLLTEDQWADYLIYRNYPQQRVYFDGRGDFYGEAMAREYAGLMSGRDGWRQSLAHWDFDTALVPSDWALVNLLKDDPAWRMIDSSKKALLFERVPPPAKAEALPATTAKPGVLMAADRSSR